MSGLAGLKPDPRDPWRMLDLNRPVSLEEANIGSDVVDGMLDLTKSIRYGGTHVVSNDRNSIVPGAVAGIALQHFEQFAKDGKMRATVIDLFDPSTRQYGTVLLYGASMAFLTKGDPSQEIDLPESFRNVVDLIRETGIKSCKDTFEFETVGIDPSLLAPPSNGEKSSFGYSLHDGEGIMGRMLLRYFSDLEIPDVEIAGSLRAPGISKVFLEVLRVAPKNVRTHVQIDERLQLILGYAHRPEQKPQDPMIKI
jgi:hypothetical protein